MNTDTGQETIEKYCNFNKMYHFEMSQGIENLNKLLSDAGYREEPFKYGSSLERFLQDNPGAIQAILEWFGNNMDEDTEQNLLSEIPESEDDEDDEDDLTDRVLSTTEKIK